MQDSVKKIIVFLSVTIFAFVLYACSSENKTEEKLINNLKLHNDSESIMLEELTDFEWGRYTLLLHI